jgi:hypothetical protein
MAGKFKPDDDPELGKDNAAKQAKIDHLEQRLAEATEVIEQLGGMPKVIRHEIHILNLAVLLCLRMAILQFAPGPPWTVMAANVIFGAMGAIIFVTWCGEAWEKERWEMTLRAALIVAALFIAASLCTDSTWKADHVTRDGALPAAGVLLVLLVIAASPIARVAIKGILEFMDSPVKYFRKKGEI